MKCALFVLALSNISLVVAQKGVSELPSFASFISQHGRTYKVGTPEYESRHALFQKRAAQVQYHNSQPGQSWTATVNHLSDRTEEELKQLRGWNGFASAGRSVGQVLAHSHGSNSRLFLGQSNKVVVPDNHTWEHLDAIKESTNQEGCGSCWAVATTTMMNAVEEIAGGSRSFSAQDLVNCVPNPHNCGGSGGCEGATVELAMNWIASNGFREKSVSPYFGSDHECYSSSSLLQTNDQAKLSSAYDDNLETMIAVGQHDVEQGSAGATFGLKFWTRLPENEQQPLLSHLVQYGPLAVSVAGSGWDGYGDGVFNSCSKDAVIDHAVVLFGYGFDPESDKKFWEIKNSWGLDWGKNGNIRLLREDTIKCGTDRQPEMGTGCDGGPKEVKVCGMCGILYDVVSVSM